MSSVSVSGFLAPNCETRRSGAGIQASAVSFPTKKVFKTFSGLKAGVACESEASFFSDETNAVLWSSVSRPTYVELQEGRKVWETSLSLYLWYCKCELQVSTTATVKHKF